MRVKFTLDNQTRSDRRDVRWMLRPPNRPCTSGHRPPFLSAKSCVTRPVKDPLCDIQIRSARIVQMNRVPPAWNCLPAKAANSFSRAAQAVHEDGRAASPRRDHHCAGNFSATRCTTVCRCASNSRVSSSSNAPVHKAKPVPDIGAQSGVHISLPPIVVSICANSSYSRVRV